MVVNRLQAWWIIHTTPAQDRVIYALMHGHGYALDIARHARLNIGRTYATLFRLERLEVVASAFEESPAPGRLARRVYTVIPFLTSTLAHPVNSPQAQRYAQAQAVLG